ncbi:hypothetical protein KBD09_01460 [Candidatus Woesebacteria bacterium]|nr:hypothetical protein [Candidatus Woesebacteria bacterium]
MGNVQQQIRDRSQEKLEQLRERSVEKMQENFSKLPSFLMEQITGKAPTPEAQPKEKNYTTFNEEIRAQLGLAFAQQDAPKVDAARSELEALKAQMGYLRKEETEAREYMQAKENERKNAEAEEDERKRIEAMQRAQAMAGGDEPVTKASRGQEKRKMPDKTMENKASFGKQ